VKKSLAPLACGLFALLLTTGASANGAATAAAAAGTPEANIRAHFARSFPTVTITSVSATQWPGVYEAVSPEGIFYADATGRYAINGKLVDVETKANLTQERQEQLGRIDFQTLPFSQALKVVKGDGHRVMAVFADPDCPYCKMLETDMKDMDNVTVYTFLLPINSLHPQATQHAKQIWCAKEPEKAWKAWVADRVPLEDAQCDSDPVDDLAKLANKLQILGTPTIFFADGRRLGGYVPRPQLEHELVSVASVSVASAADTRAN
jgi:thiol:disulfide interchange protein DsbC